MTEKRLYAPDTAPRSARARRLNDRLTRGIVSVGGMLVLLALLLIFFYLLYAVFPLFRTPSITMAKGGIAAGVVRAVGVGRRRLPRLGVPHRRRRHGSFYSAARAQSAGGGDSDGEF
ncbi:hypothetical protein ABK905_19380 [Acerihabitans sp. KWT182]|uniref:Uncharacterized protein n=1 Tax=Acerihabitans sp. KWT182 TaxID=3157919 RepID=A0AAU7Q717_9GAMM